MYNCTTTVPKSVLVLVTSVAAWAILTVAGCSSDSGTPSSGTEKTAAAEASGGDYCGLYASYVAKGVDNFNKASSMDLTDPSQVAQQQEIAKQVQENAEVSISQLEEAAPPEPKALFAKMDEINAKVNKDPMAASEDEIFEVPRKLNAWAKAHCPSKYQSIFASYDKVIN